eukprot:scaffold342178_cov23-Prasinocladus_malaysianus.AAC.1
MNARLHRGLDMFIASMAHKTINTFPLAKLSSPYFGALRASEHIPSSANTIASYMRCISYERFAFGV